MLDKTVRLTQLYDWYAPLLTEKQQEVFELYYHHNLSLAEIAADHSVSRTAVHDILVRIEGQLSRYEEGLELARRFGQFAERADRAVGICTVLKEICGDSAKEPINELREILQSLSDIWTGDLSGEGM